jgi:glycosyltransferase involved in cell wall biosynthesis
MGSAESGISLSTNEVTTSGKDATTVLDGCCMIIPALNPLPLLLELLKDLQDQGVNHILLVDDGSSVEFQSVFDAASALGVTVLHHSANMGKGAALKTAFERAYIQGYSAVVTVDADGQHRATDAVRIARQVLQARSTICVLGVRSFASDIPLRSRFGNLLTRQIFSAFSQVRVSDTQTGLRGFSADLLPQLCKVPGDRYEFEMQMLLWLAESNILIKEIPIDTIYIDNNSQSHFHPIVDSLKIYWVLFRDFFVSVSSFGIDITLFSIFHAITGQVFLSTYLSRSVSAVYNFLGSRLFVFRVLDKTRLGREMILYFLLALLLASGSGIIVQILSVRTGWGVTLCKIMTDLTLYITSFLVRRFVIFPVKSRA